MHRVVVKPGQSLFTKCPKCKERMQVQSNPNKGPLTLAFNHPRQEFKVQCPGCAQEFSWTPEELTAAAIVTIPG